jgi:NAD+ kinase
MNLGVIVNVRRPEAESTLASIQEWAGKHNWPIGKCARIDMEATPEFAAFPPGTFTSETDLLLALGGDGTMLNAVRTVAHLRIPVLGINLGTLGFLTVVPSDECAEALDRVKEQDYRIEDRLMLEVHDPNGEKEAWPAVNDIVLIKAGIARMVRFTVSHNGEPVSTFAGDGIIVATPTGSTAYSLSVGGPILMPTMSGFILTPISPHTLAQRPMVFDQNAELEIAIDSVVGNAMLTVDGQLTRHLGEGSRVIIRASEHRARLVSFSDRSFFEILREKLHWGVVPALGRGHNPRP